MNTDAFVRDLCLLTEVEMEGVRHAHADLYRAWSEAWGLDAKSDNALVIQEASGASAEWQSLKWLPLQAASRASAQCWMAVTEAAHAALPLALVGRHHRAALAVGDWACKAAEAALADLRQRILTELNEPAADLMSSYPDEEGARQQMWLPMSGAVLLSQPHLGLHWLLGPSAHRKRTAVSGAKLPMPVELTRALTGQRLAMSLGLGEVDIPVADLLGLQVGDVVQFPARLSDNLPLTMAKSGEATAALQGQLGKIDGHLAIRVVGKAPNA